jgi:alpha-ketoglutarate-dependent taurine dioxygenase
MKLEPIFPEWGNTLHVESLSEVLALDDQYVTDLVVNRDLLVVRGCGADLTDHDLVTFTSKFGHVWDQKEHDKWYIAPKDSPVDPETHVDYFKGKMAMPWHADMPHVENDSYPGRMLYMKKNTTDQSGNTTWLHLEQAWSQLTDDERNSYNSYEFVFHDYYRPNTRMEKFPFLKTNPKTNKVSPRINCYYGTQFIYAWIHHVELNNVRLNDNELDKFMIDTYQKLEQQRNVIYDHTWKEGDIVIYNNWSSVHKRTIVPNSSPRLLKRLTFNFN